MRPQEWDLKPGSAVRAIGASAVAGDLVYAAVDAATPHKARRYAVALDELRAALASRGLELVEAGPSWYRVARRVQAHAETRCLACAYDVRFQRCQRCTTRHAPLEAAC